MVALNPTEDLNILYLDIHIDHRVLLFSFLITLVVGVLFSLVPALRVSRPDLQGLLMEGNRTSTSRTGRRMVRALVVVEMAVAVILLVGAGLMLKSLGKLSSIDPGYNLSNLMVMRITPLEAKYPEQEQEVAFLERITERAESIPGVKHVAINSLFANRIAVYLAPAIAEGRDPEDPDSRILTNHRVVGPGLLDAMGIPLVAGRPIDERDQADSEPVVMISETFAKNAFPGENALDKRVKIDARSRDFPFLRVVGIVGDVLDNGDYENTWYLPYTQSANVTPYYDIIVRTEGEPLALAQSVREAIWSVDQEQAIAEIITAEELVASEFWEERSSAYLLGMFAAVGLLLSIVGIYGIQSYSVAQQNHEIGVRMVFGAMPEDVVRTTLTQGLKLSLLGLAVGIVGALALTRYMESLLHEVSPTDPLVFVGIATVALLVAVVANYLPARRVTRIDPVEMVRY
jgi:predicted permease